MYSYDRTAQTRVAFAFDTPEEREKYLKEHPKADPARHTVKQQEGKKKPKVPPPPKPKQPGAPPPKQPGAPKPEQKAEKPPAKEHGQEKPEGEWYSPEGEPAEVHPEGRKVVEGLKGLSSKAMAALKGAPAAVKKFFQDEGHRKETLGKVSAALKEAPEKMISNLVSTAKHEAHEFKEAGQGIAAVWNGKPMSKQQKKALKAVSIHMAITATAAALTTTGVVAALGFTAKALAKTVALKSVSKAIHKMDVAGELHHIGHSFAEILGKVAAEETPGQPPKMPDPSKLIAAIVLQSVQERLAEFDDDDLRETLEKAAGGEPQVKMARLAARRGPELADLCEQAEVVHKNLRAWIRDFPMVLKIAQQEAVGLEGTGLVWQDRFVRYWQDLDAPLDALNSIDEGIEGVYLTRSESAMGALSTLANMARDATSDRLIPVKARVEYAISHPEFRDHPDKRSHIAYSVERLEEWAKAFEGWTDNSVGSLKNIARKARRLV